METTAELKPEPGNAAIRTDFPFTFSGQTGEYFRIWIVNILLTVVTLGIYSAWAKVRNHRYFYGNTYLDGSAFEYTAEPLRILRGRLVAVAVVILYQLAGYFSVTLSLIAVAVILLLTPALVVLAMRFRMRYTSWRNIRFSFQPDFKAAYLIFGLPLLASAVAIALPYIFLNESVQHDEAQDTGSEAAAQLLPESNTAYYHSTGVNHRLSAIGGGKIAAIAPADAINCSEAPELCETVDTEASDTAGGGASSNDAGELTEEEILQAMQATGPFLAAFMLLLALLYLLFPWWQKFYYRFLASRSSYGNAPFKFVGVTSEFYAMYIIAMLVYSAAIMVAVFVGVILYAVFSYVLGIDFEFANSSPEFGVVLGFGLLLLIPALIFQAYLQTAKTNLIYGNLELEDIAFRSQMKVPYMFYLYLTNTLAIVLTLGLAIPWAKIRMARYRAETMTLYARDFEAFQAMAAEDVSARGAEISDFMDIDIGL